MHRLLFLLLIFLIDTTYIYGQQKRYFDKDWKETTKDKAEYYRIVNKNQQNYSVKDFYISGKLQFEGISTTDAEPLNLQGKAVWYYDNGNISQDATFTNNAPDGYSKEYYSNGKLKSNATYILGKLDKEYTEYYPNGSLAGKGEFLNGEPNGTTIKYKNPGQLDFKVNYKKGIADGEYEFYNSNGSLFYKGTAKNGFQEGLCSEYYYEGELRKTYTIHNKMLEGKYIEFSKNKDTLTKGVFKNGIAQSFKILSTSTRNGSIFSKEMTLRNGIEEWKTFRDGKLILKSFYKDGTFNGEWTVYNFNGTKEFGTIRFDAQQTCKEDYLQQAKGEFSPYLMLSDRFGFDRIIPDKGICEGIAMTNNNLPKDEHPIYHYTESKKEKTENKEEDINIVKNYIDPSSTDEFKAKNNCKTVENKKNVTVCKKDVYSISYTVYLSTDQKSLEQIKSLYKPKDLEIVYFFQQKENRDYDFNKEERTERFMTFSLSKSTKEAFQNKSLDYIVTIGALEHNFWDVSNFSGLAAYDAYEKEMKTK